MFKPLGVQSCKKDLGLSTGKKHIHGLNFSAQSIPYSKVKHGYECNTVTLSVLLDRLTTMDNSVHGIKVGHIV